MSIMLLMIAGISYTEAGMKQYSACRDKIIGYEQSGVYTSPDEFRLALSFCALEGGNMEMISDAPKCLGSALCRD
jgi:hypothetical protein